MYKQAEEQLVRRGLSPFARFVLGGVAAAFGVMMILIAPQNDKAVFFHGFGVFCLLIAVACLTTGRIRQFVGSVIGIALLALSGWYLYAELTGGPVISARRSEPSAFNAWLFFLAFGVPGAAYAIRTRFGWRRDTPAPPRG